MSFLLLPPVAFVITNVISNNLALSLGMIGALSIVRFRNPVKNPLELVIYFCLITLGIAFGVNILWGFLLLIVVIFVLTLSRIFQLIIHRYNILNLFKYSFAVNDGINKNFIEINCSKKIEFLDNNKNLLFFSSNGEGKFFYKISTNNRSEVNEIKKKVESLKEVTEIEVQYGD
tara:strand:- start:256 stop:777 length:522 start_codon:yes stop_codon:yes gene_type:complete